MNIKRKYTFSLILLVLFMISILPSDVKATLHDQTLDVIAKQKVLSKGTAQINTGDYPYHLILGTHTIYVTNSGSDTVSVISYNNTKLPDIPVRKGPRDIADNGPTIYVANSDNDTVSVINTDHNTKLTDIPVGKGPRYIADNGPTIY